MTSTVPHRLHLGASRLEKLTPATLEVVADGTWVNLGDDVPMSNTRLLAKLVEHGRVHGWTALPSSIVRRIRSHTTRHDPESVAPVPEGLFESWHYNKGDRLDFDDNTFSFIFSEHFFEHLFLDEASALFKECHRVLKPGGVIRTVVPDADLRADLPSEPLGFPNPKLGWQHPGKHKTRWSVYMLDEVLRWCEFDPLWVRYWDKFGALGELSSVELEQRYQDTCDPRDLRLLQDLSYVKRKRSLIVDGIKRALV